jgi:hypothetical protein
MINNIVTKLGLTTASIVLGLGTIAVKEANATTFNFSSPYYSQQSSLNFREDGIDLTATGITSNGSREIVQNFYGLGVKGGFLDSYQVDGLGLNETLLLSFHRTVSLISATFSAVDGNDEFRLFVDGDLLVSADIPNNNIFNFTSFAPDNKGSQFGFSVTDFNDDYYLKNIEVEAVPEPASILGLLALGAFGASSTLKRKKAAS